MKVQSSELMQLTFNLNLLGKKGISRFQQIHYFTPSNSSTKIRNELFYERLKSVEDQVGITNYDFLT